MQRLFSIKYNNTMITNGKPERSVEAYFQLMYQPTLSDQNHDSKLDSKCSHSSIEEDTNSLRYYALSAGKQLPMFQSREVSSANWIGHIWCMNCLVKHITEDKIKGRVMGRQGRRWKQVPDDLKEMRECWEMKEEALDCNVWRTGFGRGYGPAVRQIWNE